MAAATRAAPSIDPTHERLLDGTLHTLLGTCDQLSRSGLGLAFVAPVTSKPRGHAFEIVLPSGCGARGVVMVHRTEVVRLARPARSQNGRRSVERRRCGRRNRSRDRHVTSRERPAEVTFPPVDIEHTFDYHGLPWLPSLRSTLAARPSTGSGQPCRRSHRAAPRRRRSRSPKRASSAAVLGSLDAALRRRISRGDRRDARRAAGLGPFGGCGAVARHGHRRRRPRGARRVARRT